MGFGQYLKDTQGELRHVAWPTRLQTIVYTILVVLLSLFIALYLGFFDFVFTRGLSSLLGVVPQTSAPTLDMEQVQLSTSTPVSPKADTPSANNLIDPSVLNSAKAKAPAPTPAKQ